MMRFPNWMIILITIENHIASKVSRKLDISPKHTIKIINELENEKLIKSYKTGRVRKYEYTDKGLKIKQMCEDFINEMPDIPFSNDNVKKNFNVLYQSIK